MLMTALETYLAMRRGMGFQLKADETYTRNSHKLLFLNVNSR
jgi:hypothetical protein